MKSKQNILTSVCSLAVLSMIFLGSCAEPKSDCPCEDPKEVEEPKGIITEEEAAVLFKEYTEKRVADRIAKKDTAEQKSFEPARYTEFDFKIIKQYIKYIEQEAKAADTEIETLRIYYAVYPEGRGDRSNKTTVFLVPAADFDGKNKAFQIGMIGERAAADTIPWDFGTDVRKMSLYAPKDQRQYGTFGPSPVPNAPVQGNRSLVLNDGSTSPPPYH